MKKEREYYIYYSNRRIFYDICYKIFTGYPL